MTKEEAIDLLDNLIGMVEDNHNSDYDTALQIAIKALEQEPCDDAISRQAVLEQINYWGIGSREHGYTNATYYLTKRIKDIPSVNPQEPKWIPVSERLPELGEYVLATSSWGDITMAERWDENKWFIHEGSTNGTDEDVIAWMPLPKAYESEEQTDGSL